MVSLRTNISSKSSARKDPLSPVSGARGSKSCHEGWSGSRSPREARSRTIGHSVTLIPSRQARAVRRAIDTLPCDKDPNPRDGVREIKQAARLAELDKLNYV